jgi:predicted dehydrogenase
MDGYDAPVPHPRAPHRDELRRRGPRARFRLRFCFKVAGVASGHEENARRVADAHGIPYATADWKKMLDEVEADLVAIASPVDLHYPMARAALERQCHVLLEKPFALNAAQARELAALAKAHDLVAVVNHEFRHKPGRAALARWISEGKLGRVEHLVMRTRLPGWARDPGRRLTWLTEKERGGGFLGALGSHDVDQLTLYAGRCAACSRASAISPRRRQA